MSGQTGNERAAGMSRRGVLALGAVGFAGVAGAVLPRRALAHPSEPAATPQTTRTYRFKVGSIEAISIGDSAGSIAPIQPIFAPEATPEELTRVVDDAFHPRERVDLAFNVLVLRTGGETVLIDTGNGVIGRETPAALMPALAAAGITPDKVTGIVISHAHSDHVNGLIDAQGRPVFTNARVFISKAEHDFWTGPAPDLSGVRVEPSWKEGFVAAATRALGAVKDKLDLVTGGDRILGGLELVDTAGHTPGHLSVIVRDGDQSLVALGDLAHNHVLMFARPQWTVAFDTDPRKAVEARKAMFDRIASERLRVYGYHMPWPGLGHIRRRGEGYEWVIEPWVWE